MLLRRTRCCKAYTLLPTRLLSSSPFPADHSRQTIPWDAAFDLSRQTVPWNAKVISTAFALSPPSFAAARLSPLRESLTALVASEAVCRLRDPHLSLSLLSLTTSAFHVRHSLGCYRFVIHSLCCCGHWDIAHKVFDEMLLNGNPPDVVILELLIGSYACAGEFDASLQLVDRASDCDVVLSPRCCNVVMQQLMARGRIRDGVRFFIERLGSRGFAPYTCSFNMAIDGLCRLGDIKQAFDLFNDMGRFNCHPNKITHNAMVGGCCRDGQLDDALEFWREMKERNIRPNAYAFAILIDALCKQNRVGEARLLLKEVAETRDIPPRPSMFTPVIDGLCKAGNVDEANLVLAQMEDSRCGLPDLQITYAVMIVGYCVKGRTSEALPLFDKIMARHCTLDDDTVASLISWLVHGVEPEKANRIVDDLRREQRTWVPSDSTRASSVS